MRIGRCIPPAASPFWISDIVNGFMGLLNSRSALMKFQKSISDTFNVKHCFFVSSGKAALTISLKALKKRYPERKKVIIPAYDCYSVPSAIENAGLETLPCEICESSLRLDRDVLTGIVKNRDDILAICPTHLFGLPEDVDEIKKLTRDKSISVIEDAAQAMGSVFNGQYAGTSGDVGIFSLARGKVLSAGEGGVIITNIDVIANDIRNLWMDIPSYSLIELMKLMVQTIAITSLIHPTVFWLPKMIPFLKLGETIFDPDFPVRRLSGFQAGLLKNWESKINWLRKERAAKVKLYQEGLSGIEGITLITDQWKNMQLPCIRFPVKLKSKEKVQQILVESERKGLGISATYPDTVDTVANVSEKRESEYTIAKGCTRTIVTLPCHPLIDRNDMERIVKLFSMIHSVERKKS